MLPRHFPMKTFTPIEDWSQRNKSCPWGKCCVHQLVWFQCPSCDDTAHFLVGQTKYEDLESVNDDLHVHQTSSNSPFLRHNGLTTVKQRSLETNCEQTQQRFTLCVVELWKHTTWIRHDWWNRSVTWLWWLAFDTENCFHFNGDDFVEMAFSRTENKVSRATSAESPSCPKFHWMLMTWLCLIPWMVVEHTNGNPMSVLWLTCSLSRWLDWFLWKKTFLSMLWGLRSTGNHETFNFASLWCRRVSLQQWALVHLDGGFWCRCSWFVAFRVFSLAFLLGW